MKKENRKNNKHFREGIDGIDGADVTSLVYEKDKRNLLPSFQKVVNRLWK
jgi:hypothetical protein